MQHHPAAPGAAWREVAGAWLACAMVVGLALGFAEFDTAVTGVHYAVRTLHAHLPPAGRQTGRAYGMTGRLVPSTD